MRDVLHQISLAGYSSAGMVPWLGTTRPDLYAKLTSYLPAEIHRLWSERMPLQEFDSLLTQLVSLHRRCCELYGARLSR
jgi:hypothetical protein